MIKPLEDTIQLKACIFDLDGVIVDTAKYHYAAWKRMANEMGYDFSLAQNEQLKGVSRMESLDIILEIGAMQKTKEEKLALAAQKNEWYLEFILKMGSEEIMPGVLDFLDFLKKAGIRIALGSASKNAKLILEKLQLQNYFEVVIDGTNTSKAKPNPEVFLKAAAALNVPPANCIVFEDAPKGVLAALAAKMYCIGVGELKDLAAAHQVIAGFEGLKEEKLFQQLKFEI